MHVLTTDSIPFGVTIKEVWGLIETTSAIEISNKGFIRSIVESKRNEHQEAFDTFVIAVRNGYPQANFVIGTKVSTAVGSFKNGTFLYITYIGTPVYAE